MSHQLLKVVDNHNRAGTDLQPEPWAQKRFRGGGGGGGQGGSMLPAPCRRSATAPPAPAPPPHVSIFCSLGGRTQRDRRTRVLSGPVTNGLLPCPHRKSTECCRESGAPYTAPGPPAPRRPPGVELIQVPSDTWDQSARQHGDPRTGLRGGPPTSVRQRHCCPLREAARARTPALCGKSLLPLVQRKRQEILSPCFGVKHLKFSDWPGFRHTMTADQGLES